MTFFINFVIEEFTDLKTTLLKTQETNNSWGFQHTME